jgi:hypothetical protein
VKDRANVASAKSAMAQVVFFTPPRVGHDLAATAQRGEEAVLELHRHVESEIARRANRADRMDGR